MRDVVVEALASDTEQLVLDLAGLIVADDLGLWVLPAMSGEAAGRGVHLVVAAPTRALRRRLRRLGGHTLDITDTAPETAS